MNSSKLIQKAFYAIILLLVLRYLSELVIPQSYPAVIMPSFARSSWSTSEFVVLECYLHVDCANDSSYRIERAELLALDNFHRNVGTFDYLFFRPLEAKTKRGRFVHFRKWLGEDMFRILERMHHREMSAEKEVEFHSWLITRVERLTPCSSPKHMAAVKRKVVYDHYGGEVIRTEVQDSVQVIR